MSGYFYDQLKTIAINNLNVNDTDSNDTEKSPKLSPTDIRRKRK